MVLGGTGRVYGRIGWYLVVQGECRAVLVGKWWYLVIFLITVLSILRVRLNQPIYLFDVGYPGGRVLLNLENCISSLFLRIASCTCKLSRSFPAELLVNNVIVLNLKW